MSADGSTIAVEQGQPAGAKKRPRYMLLSVAALRGVLHSVGEMQALQFKQPAGKGAQSSGWSVSPEQLAAAPALLHWQDSKGLSLPMHAVLQGNVEVLAACIQVGPMLRAARCLRGHMHLVAIRCLTKHIMSSTCWHAALLLCWLPCLR
jgi:hypothetical protein